MRLTLAFIFTLLICSFGASALQAQENQIQKPPSLRSKQEYRLPPASINLGAQKLHDNMIYHIDENTHIGLNHGFNFGVKINF